MSKNKHGKLYHKNNEETNAEFSALGDLDSVASVTEYTGLIQTPPQNDYQNEAYKSIANIPDQTNKKKNTKK